MKTPTESTPPVPLFAIYRLFFVVGLCSFGGGVSSWFHREVVLVRKWMTDDEFFSGYSLAQILPGVNSTNVIAAAVTYNRLVEIPGFAAAVAGVATAAVGMIFRLGLTSAKGSLRHAPSILVLIATFTAVGIMQWPLLPVMLVLAPLSIAAAWPWKKAQAEVQQADTPEAPHE
jgi:chromate transporter